MTDVFIIQILSNCLFLQAKYLGRITEKDGVQKLPKTHFLKRLQHIKNQAKNTRFKLNRDEKMLCLKPRAYWFNVRHLTSFGTIYLTDKRIAFGATAGWKLFFAGPLIDTFTKSANIRWEAGHHRVGVVDGKGLFFRAKFMTLDGKNTGILIEEDFIDLLNTLRGS